MSVRNSHRLVLAAVLLLISCTERRQVQLLEEAETRLTENRAGESAELYRKIIAMDPESRPAFKAHYRLGFILETYLRDYEGALLSYGEFIRHSEDPVSIYEVQKRVANIYFQHLLDSEKTIEAYKKLLSSSPDSLEADFFMFRKAQSYFRLDKFDEARKYFQGLLEKFPKSSYAARSRYGIANTYFMQNAYSVAIEALKQVVRFHPNSDDAVEAQFLMAQCLEHDGKTQQAESVYISLRGRYPARDVLELRINQIQKRAKVKK